MLNIGVIGYSNQDFNSEKAKEHIRKALNKIENKYNSNNYCIISGYTDLGIPALAYREANKRDYKTVGIACSKAKQYETYPVDRKYIIGSDWSDESQKFLEEIDCLIQIGGGEQSKDELEKAKKLNIPIEYSTSL
jgi:predicted Rossmann-fold nucleotide-binding protein